MNNILLYVGIDDTDSSSGMCTTYITCVIISKLKDCGFNITGHPRLIRLNPFARFKTRGNGATSFKLELKSLKEAEEVKKIVLENVQELSVLEDERTNPGVVFYNNKITPELQEFSLKAIRNIVSIEDAENLLNKVGADFYKFKNGRGIIGALAAISCPLNDKTYELLAYRISENYGKPRQINHESVREMDKHTYPKTFDNLDEGYIAIEPHTPCPVLYGIRSENPEILMKAKSIVKVTEQVERYCVYLTNQHTDMHLQKVANIENMEKFQCYIVEGVVKDKPHVIEGGHLIFTLKDESGEIECAAYEPTKRFRDFVRELEPEDILRVYGGVGEGINKKGTLNIEKFELLELAIPLRLLNPICDCGKRMKSAGAGKGYKCPICGAKIRDGKKERIEISRNIEKGFYETPPSARRHLSKPIIRKK
ncbi:tRNA(Ile)(2)-agmatinylcytidine synthase [Methanobacterium sp. SMA-27]|uniref:tRNA(Ile)(2)-agmatinylcytidine synthase n=1 Tax=Methanobacterium sp. SMA-27 TaxID=1495336 RepID=UPI00064E9A74|nr:tRNA(Ile)(2)-agmatinylcytidine synthase [Methanobacterium sp. SMA-27]